MLEAATGLTPRGAVARGRRNTDTLRRRAPEPRRREILAQLSLMARTPISHGPRPAASSEPTAVARAWLDLIHSGRWASSWEVAGPVLKDTIDPEEWQAALRALHASLGRCRSRTLQGQATLDRFPGVPSGPWTVIHFESRFEERDAVIETVATCRGNDGCWHPTAYFVR